MSAGISLPPLPPPGGCQGWKNTDNCDPHGPRNPSADAGCNSTIGTAGDSGYCLCAGGVKVYGDGCGHPAGYDTCTKACAAPVPQWTLPEGREVVLKFNSGLNSNKVFHTDSNGREMVKRIRDGRGAATSTLFWSISYVVLNTYATPHAPCDVLNLVPMLNGC